MKKNKLLVAALLLAITASGHTGTLRAADTKAPNPDCAAAKSAEPVFDSLQVIVIDGKPRVSFQMAAPLLKTHEDPAKLTIRIYQTEVPDADFGVSLKRLKGLAVEKAEKLFEGTLPVDNKGRFTFVDSQARLGATYAYWVSSDRNDPPVGAVAVQVCDPTIWWPYVKIDARLEALAKKWPDLVTLKKYGETAEHRPLKVLVAGNPKKTIALLGCVHAGESGPELFIPIVERLCNENREVLKQVGIAMLPSVNADQRERQVLGHPSYLRTNSRGVDINRNFDADWNKVDFSYGASTADPKSSTYRGPSPVSEPETKAVEAFIDDLKPQAVFSFHWLASLTGGRLVFSKEVKDLTELKAAGRPYILGFYGRPRNEMCGPGAAPGSLPHWAYTKRKIPAYDVEGDDSPECKAAQHGRTTPAMLTKFQELHYRGLLEVLKTLAKHSASTPTAAK